MIQINVPARTDPCWKNAAWRSDKLHECVKRHGLSRPQIAALTGASHNTVKFWMTNHESVIGADALRALLLDLNSRVA